MDKTTITQINTKINFFKFILNHPLTRKNRLGTIKNFLFWQIGSRILPGDACIPFVNNCYLWIKTGMTGATLNIYVGLAEFEDMAFVAHFLRPEDIFFDVGANVGVYSILASGVSGSKTVSIEPIQESFENLRRNINLNNLDSKIRIIHAAAGRENGIIKMTRNMDTMNHVVIPSEEETQNICEVPVIKLDDLVQDGITQIIKIDVEGFESNVIEGAKTMLSQRKICAVIMELNGAGERYGISDEYIHNLLLEYGFSTFQYFPFKRQLLSLNDRINRNGGNTLYVQNNTLDFVKERLIKASSFNVKGFEI